MNSENFIGKQIGKYQIMKIIGEGAFSTVCLAKEINFQSEISKDNNQNDSKIRKKTLFRKKYIACKIIPRVKVDEKKITTRLDQEIRVQRMMHHMNVVQLIDVHKDPTFYYIFLEFCPNGELFNIVIKKKKIEEKEAAFYFKQILIGLQYIHSMGVAHRDLKPENILIDSFGRVKIADFGLSKLLSNCNHGYTTTPCGSPCYASPECISGNPYDGRKSDIWSCGVILYAITTGFLPWTERSQAKMFNQIKKGEYKVPSFLSDNCADLIYRLMTVDFTKRITIEDALNHPFLKNVFIPNSKIDQSYVSLKKVDRFLEIDEDFEYDFLKQLQFRSDSKFETNFVRVRKGIKSEDEKKKEKEIEIDQNNCILLKRVNSNVKINLNSNSDESKEDEKRKKSKKINNINRFPPIPQIVSPRKSTDSRCNILNRKGLYFNRRFIQSP